MTTTLPTFIQIEPVGQCNLSCVMCPVNLRTDRPRDGSPAFMPFGRFMEVIDQWPGLKELHLQGLGEPMMHPRFFDMVGYAAQRGIAVSCNSNLTLVNDARAERCVTSGLRTLNVSLDGAKAETYEAIRAGAKFSRVLTNIRRVQRTRSRLRSTTPDLVLTVVVMRRNLREVPDLVRLAHELRIHSVFVQHLGQEFTEPSVDSAYRSLRAFVQQESLLQEDRPAIEDTFTRARVVAADLNVTLRLPRIEPVARPPGDRRCEWPWKGAYLTYQGYAVPCCMIATPDRAHFGNVFDRSVPDVWNSAEADAFRRRLDSDDPPDLCAACAVYKGVF
ncbi:MAG TPA: radical SAM protein [Nitrospiraceae bacterium]|nr:radical SAM protein [Nitrospiraceae bacterium]